MSESMSSAEGRVYAPPTYIGAVFETGRSKSMVKDYSRPQGIEEYLVPCFDVKDSQQRRKWGLENMRVFSDGTLSSPEWNWKGVIDFHLSELKVAAVRANLDSKERVKTEKEIKAMMAVSSSARAMEYSGGSVEDYALCITQSEKKANLDRQDNWRDFLLHDDLEKIKIVLDVNIINFFYRKIIDDAGIKIIKDITFDKEKQEWEKDEWKIDNPRKALNGKLFEYLISENPYPKPLDDDPKEKEIKYKRNEWFEKHKDWEKKNSLEDYINDVLLKSENVNSEEFSKNYSETEKWSAARIAADIFLVDKYTQWDFDLASMVSEIDQDIKIMTKPSPRWGGDPLKGIIDPSFLPRIIKKVYTGEDSLILTMADDAFRPDFKNEEIKKDIEGKLPCSLTVNLKNLVRYSRALFAFFGDSRAGGIPQWGKEGMESLAEIVNMLDQVYGTISKPNDKKLGKEIVGVAIAEIIRCKALATAVESSRPGFSEAMGTIFGDIKTNRPFLEVEQALWGEKIDGKSGFLSSLAGGRTRIIFKDNRFGAIDKLDEAGEIFSSNDQDPQGRGKAKILNVFGFLMDTLTAFSPNKKR